MKKKNSKDKLEDLFRNLFNDSRRIHQPEGWNVPPEDFWDNIQKGLHKGKKKEKGFLYWNWVATAASVLLLLSVFQLYQSNQQIKRLSKRVIESDQVVQKIQADLQALSKKSLTEIQVANTQREQLEPVTYNQTKLSSSIFTDKSNSLKKTTAFNSGNTARKPFHSKFVTTSSPNEELGEATFKAIVSSKYFDEKEKNNQNEGLNISLLEIEKTLNIISSLDQLSTSIHQLDLKDRPINWTSLTIPSITKKRPKSYLAIEYSPALTTVKNKVAESEKNNYFPRQETQKTAFSTGLRFGIKWNKGWSLETGLSYSSINKLIQHNRIISYKSLQEHLNSNGDYESNINLQLGSSEGAVDTDISLARSSSSTVASDANFNMDIAFTSDRNYLDVPLIVKKEWAIGAFALSLKAGLLNRFLLTKNFELQQVILDDNRFNSTPTAFRERQNSKSKSDYSAHYLMGIGLEYAFRPEISFYVEPTFIRSMQPVISPRGTSIYTKSKMFNIGLRYML